MEPQKEDEQPIIKNRKKIAQILRERRKELGYTQEELASLIGIKYNSLNRIESARFFISTKLLLQLLDALKLKIIFTPRNEDEGVIEKK